MGARPVLLPYESIGADAMTPLYATYAADPVVKELVDRIRSDSPTPEEAREGR